LLSTWRRHSIHTFCMPFVSCYLSRWPVCCKDQMQCTSDGAKVSLISCHVSSVPPKCTDDK
jgi:hypothetical protein